MVGSVEMCESFGGAVPTQDSMLLALVEPTASPVFSPSSSTTRGSSEVCQKNFGCSKMHWGHILTATNFTGLT